ncbi:hypothetical protein QTQ03_18125 [Micromonospora sp. WMMA1363]|uniref:hypothetical protein n=1 Tax=Micromonospora sp. WMMA1363 TaxID=3053985 RepID=UPI00259CF4F8|nr:hypothetical protein [Micromonospora sp. WMMA1363]MDM4721423.1 hypothetical protein [Micromonospora sp. WMMA1363]
MTIIRNAWRRLTGRPVPVPPGPGQRRRRRRSVPLDVVGPATCYGRRVGGHAGAGSPTWDGPTFVYDVAPLLTRGQRYRSGGRR